MGTIFLKENIIQSRQNDNSGKNAIKLLKIDKQNEFLFEKHANQFLDLIDFLKNRDDVWVLTGFPMSGKTLLTSIIPRIISNSTIYVKFKCTPASTLDDLLLTFFKIFKLYAQQKLVRIPKIETQNFQEKINIYLSKCENPIIILLDGLNEIANEKNKDAIMNFLSQIVNIENIKLIITTRNFNVADLKNIDLRLSTSLIKPFTKDDLRDYCLKNIINSDGIEDFYKLSRGHYINLRLMMNYLQPTNLTIEEFLDEVKSSNKSIDEIVIAKNLTLVPQKYMNLLWVVALSDFGMPISNLLTLEDCEEEQITFLQKKNIVEIFDDCVFINDYFKTDILKSIEPLAQTNITKSIIKFLEAQLPLKPSVRDLGLSRLTIRNEIERLTKIVNKTSQLKVEPNKTSYINILGYSRQYKTNWDGFDEIIMPKNMMSSNEDKKVKKENKKEEFVDNKIVQPQKEEETNEALKLARMLKDKYLYKDALEQYFDAINIENKNGYSQKITIYKDIAECFAKLGDYTQSIENYRKAHELANKEGMANECCVILLKIAEIYKLTYKKDSASEIYRDILKKEGIDSSTLLEAELNLFEVNFVHLLPTEIIDKYFELLIKAKDNKEITAKIYFRLGFLYDKSLNLDDALNYYEHSVDNCSDYRINENLSSCYYNMAEIYMYKKDFDKALDYYLKSYSIDEITKNLDCLITTTKKIANLYEKKKDDMALEYYQRALEYAKKTEDNYPIACAFIDLGDYYYRQKQDLKALKVYISAQKILKNQLTQENEQAITDRINDLKVRMGKEIVENLMREFK